MQVHLQGIVDTDIGVVAVCFLHAHFVSSICTVKWINFEGEIFMDWIVNTFCGYIFEDYN